MFFKTTLALLTVLAISVHCLPVAENQRQVQVASNGRFVLVTPVSQLQLQPVFRVYPQFYQPSTIARIDGFRQDEGAGGDNNWFQTVQNWFQNINQGGSQEGESEGGDSASSDSTRMKENKQPEQTAESNDKQKFQTENQKFQAQNQKFFFVSPASTYPQPAETNDKQKFQAENQKFYIVGPASTYPQAAESNDKQKFEEQNQKFQTQNQKFYFVSPASTYPQPAETNDKQKFEKQNQKFQAQNQKFYYTTPASTYPLDAAKRFYFFADQPTQYYQPFDGFPSVSLNPGFSFQAAQTFLARSNANANNEILSSDVSLNPKTDAIAAVINNPLDPLQPKVIASAPLQPAGQLPELQGRLGSVELSSSVVSSQVQNNVPLVISEARSHVTVPVERSNNSEGNENDNDENDSEDKRRKQASIAQAKPTAIAVAGPGGVASSSPRATAVAASAGGLAVASPTATAVSGDLFGSGTDTNVDIADNVDDDKRQDKRQ